MKVNIEMEMTPQEARAFMGLPDVAPMQEQMLEEMRARMRQAFDTGEPEAMMQAWAPFWNGSGISPDAVQKFQKFFWDNAALAASGGKKAAK
jgi:hypothetical protein